MKLSVYFDNLPRLLKVFDLSVCHTNNCGDLLTEDVHSSS